MARKIFVSYKHHDSAVQSLNTFTVTTVRDYVNKLEELFEKDHIYKGERDGEDLSAFTDETVRSHLREKLFDSSITIVLISKNMKEIGMMEKDQWIPWEISYSLREKVREDRSSNSNAMLGIVLPDESASYAYVADIVGCPHCNSTRWKTDTLFRILGKNMFNRKEPRTVICQNGICGIVHTGNDHSYIYPITWDQFLLNTDFYLEHATQIRENIGNYEILKSL